MIKDYETVQDFAEDFDLVENALDMRTLDRWNGREFRKRENLSEHTHLVTACAINLYDDFKNNAILASKMCFEKIVRCAMAHDSLELLRGDILSVTKDIIPGLRDWVDGEEELFMQTIFDANIDELTNDIVKLADLMACYKFVERELRYPHNEFVAKSYIACKDKYMDKYKSFISKYGIKSEKIENDVDVKFVKGYEADAGTDVILQEDVVFLPLSTQTIDLGITCTPSDKQMSILCSRTSAANKGLVVAMCPIDPNYTGRVSAIVHNVSNNVITYKKGEAFCQLVTVPIMTTPVTGVKIKNVGKRTDGKLGSTGK